MKLSTKSRYGLRILVQMALTQQDGEKLSKGHDIARKQRITEAYFEQIIIPLKRAGLVDTVRGCNGGYVLRKPAGEINVLGGLELFDGDFWFADCTRGTKKCRAREHCPTAPVWEHLAAVLREEAGKITLESIVRDYCNKSGDDYTI